jgi:O-antigen ligase
LASPAVPRAAVLAAALPLIFLHDHYQPLHFGVGGIDGTAADLALLAVAIATVLGLRDARRELLRARSVWLALGAFFALIVLSTLYGPLVTDGYDLRDHAITAAKYLEYGVLAPAVPVLVRSRRDADVLGLAVVAWSAVATTVGVLQFLGLVDEFEGRRPGQREPSLLGVHELAGFSAACLALAFVALAVRRAPGLRSPWVTAAALVSGLLGVVIAGALAAVGAVVLVAAVVLLAGRRLGTLRTRAAVAVLAATAAAVAGSVLIRGEAIDELLRFVGVREEREQTTEEVQTYSHRTVLGYIGLRIYADRPVLGAGWQGSTEPAAFEPQLEPARRRYPDVAAEAFPSREHPWGVQNAYVQALADMGVQGLVALLAVLVAAAVAAYRRARSGARAAALALVAVSWLVVAAAELTALGLVAGTSLDALLWLAVGLAVASADA